MQSAITAEVVEPYAEGLDVPSQRKEGYRRNR